MCSSRESKTILYSDLEKKVVAKSLSIDNLNECLKEYSKLNVLYISNLKNEITLL